MSGYVPWQVRHGVWPDERREHDPSYTLERHIAETRARLGEERWAALNAEWDLEPAQVLVERRGK